MKTVSIRNGEWSLMLAPEVGMNPISLRHRGQPILREPMDEAALRGDAVLYGMPVLLPANRTENACFSFEGKEYQLPLNEPRFGNHLHGRIYDAPFTVLRSDDTSVSAMLENDGAYYPFPFRLCFEDELRDTGYLRRVTLTNTGKTALPFTMAFHSTFVEPKRFVLGLGERFACNARCIPTGEMLPLNEQEAAFADGFSPDGSRISGYYTSASPMAILDGWKFEVSDGFDEWVTYNGNGHEGYLCIEPQCGEVNGLNTDGHRVLMPQESAFFTLSVTSYQ